MTLSRALQEAYASGDEDGIEITTLEIDHPSRAVALRLAANVESLLGDPGDTIGLPVVGGGSKVPHMLCAFTLVRPGADQDGPTDGKIQIDNVSDLLHDLLKGVIGYDAPITVGFRQYRVMPGALDAVTAPDEDIAGLLMTTVEVDANRSEGTIAWPDGRTQNVPTGPNAFFSRSDYPGLFS